MSAEPKNKDKIMRIGIGAGLGLFSLTLILLLIDEQHYEPVWEGMSCDEMIDWSGTDAHHNMQNRGHNAFHKYYTDNCDGMIEMEMIKNNMNMTK